jgi:hypothetical protein
MANAQLQFLAHHSLLPHDAWRQQQELDVLTALGSALTATKGLVCRRRKPDFYSGARITRADWSTRVPFLANYGHAHLVCTDLGLPGLHRRVLVSPTHAALGQFESSAALLRRFGSSSPPRRRSEAELLHRARGDLLKARGDRTGERSYHRKRQLRLIGSFRVLSANVIPIEQSKTNAVGIYIHHPSPDCRQGRC